MKRLGKENDHRCWSLIVGAGVGDRHRQLNSEKKSTQTETQKQPYYKTMSLAPSL